MHDINNILVGEMPCPQTGATQYHAQLGLPDKGRAIKGLVVSNDLDLFLYLHYGLALNVIKNRPQRYESARSSV